MELAIGSFHEADFVLVDVFVVTMRMNSNHEIYICL